MDEGILLSTQWWRPTLNPSCCSHWLPCCGRTFFFWSHFYIKPSLLYFSYSTTLRWCGINDMLYFSIFLVFCMAHNSTDGTVFLGFFFLNRLSFIGLWKQGFNLQTCKVLLFSLWCHFHEGMLPDIYLCVVLLGVLILLTYDSHKCALNYIQMIHRFTQGHLYSYLRLGVFAESDVAHSY